MALVARRLISERLAAVGSRGILVRTSLLAAGWWILAAGDPRALGFGVPVVLAALVASLALPSPASPGWRALGLLRFAWVFITGSVRGGIDVARRALARRVRIAPEIIAYTLRLPEGPARSLFVGTVNLMPGTVSLAVDGRRLRIHALAGDFPALARQFELLERRVAGALGERLEDGDA